MATQVQFRGGSTSEHSTFTGAAREITVDTTLNTVVVHDGATAGGHPLANKNNPRFTGNVGIGTTSPTSDLEIEKTTSASLEVGNTVGQRVRIEGGSSGISFTTPNALNMTFGTSNTERLRITSSGNVGIGTSSPSYPLDVKRSSAGNVAAFTGSTDGGRPLKFISADNGIFLGAKWTRDIESGGGIHAWSINDTERMRIDSAGNVGIGVTSTSSKLEVDGNIGIGRVAGGYTFREVVGGTERAGIKSNSSNELLFNVGNASEAMRVAFDGKVGIGTSSPGTALHVVTSGAGAIRHADGTRAVELGSDGSTSYIGSITAGQDFALHAGGGEKARIDSAGNVGIGTSGGATGFGNVLRQKASGGASGYFAEGSNSDTWLGLYSGTSTGDSSALFFPSTGSFRIGSTTATGTTGYSEKLRITNDGYVRLAGGGIQFNGDTAAANALDDYEEGTWTPVFIGTSTAGTPTYNTNGQAGKYTKVGNAVTAWAYVDVTALGGAAGNINITGLPFSISNNGFGASGLSVGHADGTLGNSVRAYHNTTFLELRNNNSVVTAATGQIYVSITYTT